MGETVVHRVMVKGFAGMLVATAAIEAELQVEVHVKDQGRYGYALDWHGPRDVDLDFLRPHILPPKERVSG